jgi:hypothetical protein
MTTRRLLAALIAARARRRWPALPAMSPQLRALRRRVVAARLGGDSRPVPAARALFDDVQ